MMRAALILVGLSALVIMELETPPRTTKTASEPLVQSTVGRGESRDTLTKADRLEITYVQYEPPAQPISSVEPMTPPDVTPIIPQQAPNKVAQRRPGANEKKVVVVKPKPRPKHPESKKAAKTDRSKATIEIKSCRPNAFDGLLKALNISPGCET
jgi:outer membrane biosynthesis protein TonB